MVPPAVSIYNHHHHQPAPGIYTTLAVLPLVVEHQQQQQSLDQQIASAEQWSAENLSLVPLVHDSDVAHELAQVDEYVRSCAEDAGAGTGTNLSAGSLSTSSSPPSPCTSSSASVTSEDSTDDPDWSCDAPATGSSGSRPSRGSSSSSSSSGGRRSKPYSRPCVEDKRVRKKEQNKNAATRYRQKKKQEVKLILGEEQELADRNDKLHGQVKDLQREIGYLKGLMRDLFKAKGLIK